MKIEELKCNVTVKTSWWVKALLKIAPALAFVVGEKRAIRIISRVFHAGVRVELDEAWREPGVKLGKEGVDFLRGLK